MKYALVSTVNYILLVDLESKKVTPIENHRPEYYGISWFPEGRELNLSHSGLDNNTLIDVSTYAQSEVGYISSGSYESKPFLSQPHQILCTTDKRIITTNTGRNVITVVDLKNPTYFQEAAVGKARWDRLSLETSIGEHLNSVFLKDDRLFVIAHGHKKGSQLAVFSYPSLELTHLESFEDLRGMHNVWVTSDESYICCHTEGGGLVDIRTKELLWSGTEYIRGLAACKDYMILGESQRTGRGTRGNSFGGLWVLDRKTWKTIDYIPLGPFGGVHEVRILDVADEAHHGYIFQGLEDLLKRDMYSEITQERLTLSHALTSISQFWAQYRWIFGCALPIDDGAKYSKDILCLVIKQQTPNINGLSFNYQFDLTAQNAHISAVFGYQGRCDDTNMNALLLARQETTATLVLWQHDGKSWVGHEDVYIHNLPLEGSFSLMIMDNKILVHINDEEILCLNPEKMGIQHYKDGLGIRWIGASVKPKTEESLMLNSMCEV